MFFFHHVGWFSQVLQLEQNLQKLREEQTEAEAQTATSTQVHLEKQLFYGPLATEFL